MVVNLWFDDKKIKEDSIINSFYKTTITFLLDGSKGNEYEFPEEVSEPQQQGIHFKHLSLQIHKKKDR